MRISQPLLRWSRWLCLAAAIMPATGCRSGGLSRVPGFGWMASKDSDEFERDGWASYGDGETALAANSTDKGSDERTAGESDDSLTPPSTDRGLASSTAGPEVGGYEQGEWKYPSTKTPDPYPGLRTEGAGSTPSSTLAQTGSPGQNSTSRSTLPSPPSRSSSTGSLDVAAGGRDFNPIVPSTGGQSGPDAAALARSSGSARTQQGFYPEPEEAEATPPATVPDFNSDQANVAQFNPPPAFGGSAPAGPRAAPGLAAPPEFTPPSGQVASGPGAFAPPSFDPPPAASPTPSGPAPGEFDPNGLAQGQQLASGPGAGVGPAANTSPAGNTGMAGNVATAPGFPPLPPPPGPVPSPMPAGPPEFTPPSAAAPDRLAANTPSWRSNAAPSAGTAQPRSAGPLQQENPYASEAAPNLSVPSTIPTPNGGVAGGAGSAGPALPATPAPRTNQPWRPGSTGNALNAAPAGLPGLNSPPANAPSGNPLPPGRVSQASETRLDLAVSEDFPSRLWR